MPDTRIYLGWIIAGLAAGLSSGCAKTDAIEHYTVRKPAPIEKPAAAAAQGAVAQPAGEPLDRMLAAIVPHGEQGWFFKLTGPKDAVAAQGETFTTFLKSLHFSAEDKPEWTLPAGWQQRGASEMRYATLSISGDGAPLELSVTALPKPPGDEENYVLVNINRWRGQMKLPPIAREQLPAESTQFEVDGAQATLVNLLGTAAAGGMGRPPFLGGSGNGN